MEDNQPQPTNPNQPEPAVPAGPEPLGTITTVQAPAEPAPISDAQPAVATPPAALGTAPPPKAGRKLPVLLIIAIGLVLLLGGSAGTYYGHFMPNKPENIWKSALSNTGKGFEKLAGYADEQKDKTGSTLNGTYKLKAQDFVLDGSFETKSDQKDSVTKLDAGAMGVRINLDILATIPDNSTYPDVYVHATGLDGLGSVAGAEPYAGLVNQLNNQWFVIDHTLFDQLQNSAAAGGQSNAGFTAEDVRQIQEAVGRAASEYVFTSNTNKSVFRVAKFIGKETADGRQTFHYKVRANKKNLKAFATKLKDELKQTKLAEMYGGENFEEAINFDDLLASIDELGEDDTFDVWVDAKTRLVRTVRITDKENSANYIDLGLKYTGGDSYPFYVSFRSSESGTEVKANLNLTLNTATDKLNLDASLDVTGTSPVSGTLKGEMTLHNEDVTFNTPTGAKSIMELYGGLMGGENIQQTLGDNIFLDEFPIETDL
ncbi:MAG: hypothetical protein WAQ57_02060 [Candidatus Saccharimonadales bacterium]